MSDLDLDHIVDASLVIDDAFRNSPQFVDPELSAEFGRDVVVKLETANPLRSFKGRGAEYFVHRLQRHDPLVCVSAGNFGQALAYAARRHAVPVTVFVASTVDPVKRSRMRAFGADVVDVDGDVGAAEKAALEFVRAHPGHRWIQDGREPAVAEGAGTIGLELLRGFDVDTVVVPVGDAALINGIGCWVKHHDPSVRVVGVGAVGAPAMADSWRRHEVVTTGSPDTIAAGLAISSPIPESVRRLWEFADDMALVTDDDLVHAMDLVARTVGVLLEPAGAAAIAALTRHDLPGATVAAVLTGARSQ